MMIPESSCIRMDTLPDPEYVQQQLQIFLNGATRISKVRCTEVAQAAICLLKSTEAAREACLEHAYNLFDESVNNFLKLEVEERTSEPNSSIIEDFYKVLSDYVEKETAVWTPVVSTWALELLGYISSKYADRRGILHATLPEVLQLWMSCPPTRTLIDLTTQCLSTCSNVDPCIDALIETSVQHSPHFDWVVAHIGSCFPTTVITRVLACGMKDFLQQDIVDEAQLNANKNPKIASVVGILGHLATHHDSGTRSAVRNLFNESLAESATREQLAAGPFLLHLAAMSDMLSHVISSEFVKIVNPEILNKICHQVEKWKTSKIPGTDGMTNLVVHLLLRSEGGCQVIMCLLKIMPPSEPDVNITDGIKAAAGLILDSVLLEIQRRAYGGAAEIPLLHFLKTHITELTSCLSDPETNKASWVLNLFKFICFIGEDPATMFIIGHLLSNLDSSASCISNIYQDIRMHQPGALSQTLTFQMAELKSSRVEKPVTLIQNITSLCQREQWHLLVTQGMSPNLEVLAGQINSRDTDYSDAVVELLSICINPRQMPVSSLFVVCTSVVSYLFDLLGRSGLDPVIEISLINNVKSLLANLSQQSSAQHSVLRMLLEGVTDKKYSHLFGGSKQAGGEDAPRTTSSATLLNENIKYMSSITLPQSHSSVFHSGIIGSGLRVNPSVIKLEEDVVLLNKQVILDTIQACCKASWRFPQDETPNSNNPSLIPGMKVVALLMVELISPDVMFNGLPWPDDEYLKQDQRFRLYVTVERDLHIKRMFEDHQLLWDLLSLVATVHPSLCYCSVLLRAVMAVLLFFWSSSQEKATTDSPKELVISQRLINIMAMGQLLPPPLSYIDEVLPLVTPYEAYNLLSDIWQYMRDNVPSPALFYSNSTNPSRVWRDFSDGKEGQKQFCDKKYTNKLRFILFANIEKFGAVYAKFFPVE